MPDQFADVLDRLDISIEDTETMGALIAALDTVLKDNQPKASGLQIDIAAEKFRVERERLKVFGYSTDFYRRRDETILQVRDARGRFVGTGRATVERILRFGF